MKTCTKCGSKIRAKLHSYSSGDGSLSLSWIYECGNNTITADRRVSLSDVCRYLNRKDQQCLVQRNWLPALIDGRWVLARHVKRTGPTRVSVSGHSYEYEITGEASTGRVEDCYIQMWFKVRVGGKMVRHELKNQSIRMVIRYFLNHEKELKPVFRNHKVIKGEI